MGVGEKNRVEFFHSFPQKLLTKVAGCVNQYNLPIMADKQRGSSSFVHHITR
jgi:hypothetical protein